MNDSIVIFGSNGMLGHTLIDYFTIYTNYHVIPLTRKHIDVSKNDYDDQLVNLFKLFPKNSIIINTIGLIPHTGNTCKEEYYKINGYFPRYLDELCNLYNFKLVTINL